MGSRKAIIVNTTTAIRAKGVKLHVSVPRSSTVPHPVVIGCPFDKGALEGTDQLALCGPGGECVLSARPLVRWLDGSVRWALLAFATTEPGDYTLVAQESPTLIASAQAAWVEEDSREVRLGNGRLSVTLSRQGPGPVSSLICDGQRYLTGPAALQFTVGDASSLYGDVESVEVIESSPVRAMVAVSGHHRCKQGKRQLSYRLTIEVWAGVSALRLDHQFFNLAEGEIEQRVDSISMVMRPNLKAMSKHRFLQSHHGLRMKPRTVTTDRRVDIVSDWTRDVPYVSDRAMLDDSTVYPAYLDSSCTQTQEWLGLAGADHGLYLYLHEMAQLRPKRLTADGGELRADLWPEAAGPLRIPQGRSRRHTMTMACAQADASEEEVCEQLTALLYEGRATLSPHLLRTLSVFDQDLTLMPGKHARLERYLHQLVRNVDLGTGLFDYGDGTEAGYFHNYVRVAKQPLRPGAVPTGNAMRPDSPDAIYPADPRRYEPVWANNEYDLIHAVSVELMRTGKRDLWPLLRGLARHHIEVDFVHYSDDPYLHHGTPAHSAYHNLSSAYPSHIWTQGLIEYYCLTGDRDALDTSIKLGDTIIRNLDDPVRSRDFWGFNREIGWALLALVQLEEVTDLPRFRQYADRIADYLTNYDRDAQAAPVNLANVDPLDDIHSQIVGAFYGYASMVEAIDRHARLTGRTDLHCWLRDLLEKVRQSAVEKILSGNAEHRLLALGMAIGYELTGDRVFLDTGMVVIEMLIDSSLWIKPPTEVKAVAMIHRGLIRFLHHADKAGLLDSLDYPHAKRLGTLRG